MRLPPTPRAGSAAGGRLVTAPLGAFLVGMILGFSLTIPPGPMNALIVARSVRSARDGTLTGLGAMVADLVLAILVYGLRSAVDLQAYLRPVYALGAVAMGFLAYRLLATRNAPPTVDPRRVATFSQALGVGVTNPLQIVWWLTAGLAFAYIGGILLFVGIFVGIAVWIVVFPIAVHAGTRRLSRGRQWISVGSAVVLLGFAAYFALLAG